MTLIPDTKDTTPQTLQNEYPAGNPAVNLNTLRSTVNANHLTDVRYLKRSRLL